MLGVPMLDLPESEGCCAASYSILEGIGIIATATAAAPFQVAEDIFSHESDN